MHRYTPYYCEENVWWLAQDPRFAEHRCEVVFVSNPHRTCALFHQRAAPSAGAPVVWDYHVVLAAERDGARELWDLDCTLGAPLPARDWLAATFGLVPRLPSRFWPRFRVVPAARYVETLASDRSHMRTRGGRYREPPPSWPCIGEGAPNLMRFVETERAFLGEVLDLAELVARWAPRSG